MVLATAAHFRDPVGCVGRWEVHLVACWGGPAGFLGTIQAVPGGLHSDLFLVPGVPGLGAAAGSSLWEGGNCPGRTGVLQLWGTPA